MRSLPMAYHRIIQTTMYTDKYNSTDLIGAFCELMFPRKGHRNDIIIDDYGTEWLVQLTNGKEVSIYKDEVFIILKLESPNVTSGVWTLLLLLGCKNLF